MMPLDMVRNQLVNGHASEIPPAILISLAYLNPNQLMSKKSSYPNATNIKQLSPAQ